MGDAGHLTRLECRYLKFNYLGDTHLISGVVREVGRGLPVLPRLRADQFHALIDVWAKNKPHYENTFLSDV